MRCGKLLKIAPGLATICLSTSAFAQATGSVTTAPLQQAPAVGTWLLAVLTVAMAGAAMYRLRRTVVTPIVGLVLISVLLISLGYAVTFITIDGAQCGQETTRPFNPGDPNVLESQCPNQIEITDIEVSCGTPDNPSANPPTIETCKIRQVLNKGELCTLPKCD